MTTTTDTARLIIDTSQATPALARLQTGLGRTTNSFSGLKTTLAGIGFAAFAAGALNAADELGDLAESTGIIVARLVELQNALDQVGGHGSDVAKIVTTFTKSIDAASQGSLKAQNDFAKLGVSLDDLRKLSEYDLMQKTLEGFKNLSSETERSALTMSLFGKAARTITASGLAEELKATAGEGDRAAEGINKAAVLTDKYAKSMNLLRLAFLEAFAPAIEGLAKLVDYTNKSKTGMDALTGTFKALGAWLAAVFSLAVLNPFIKGLGTVLSLFGTFARFVPVLRAIAVLFSAGVGIYAASKLFDNFGDIASNAIARIIEGLGTLAADILNLPTDALAAFLNLFGADIKKAWGLGTPIQDLVDKAKAARLEYEKTAKAAKDIKDAAKKSDPKKTDPSGTENRVLDRTEFDIAISTARQIGDAFRDANAKISDTIDLENSLIGASKQYADVMRASNDITNRTTEEIKKLQDAKARLTKDQLDAGVAEEYDRQIDRVIQLGEAEKARLNEAINLTQQLTAAENLRQYGINRQFETQRQIRSIQDETAKLTLTEIEKKYYDIAAAARESARAAIEAEETRRNEKLNPEEIAAYYKKAEEGVMALSAATKDQWLQARSFSTGWKQAWNEYADNANNAAIQARNMFSTFSTAFESAFDQMVRTGKVAWKDLLTDMVAQLIKSDVQRLFASITTPAGSGGSGGGLLSNIGRFFAGGFAGGGFIPAGFFGLTGENGPEYVNGPATVTPMKDSGGVTNHFYITAMDSQDVARALSPHSELIAGLTMKGRRALGYQG